MWLVLLSWSTAWVTSKAPHTLLWVIVAWYLIPSMIVQNKSLAIFRKEISCVRTKNIKELACLIFMLHIWLWVGGLRTWGRYGILVWNIGGDRRHTPTIVPPTPKYITQSPPKILLMKYQQNYRKVRGKVFGWKYFTQSSYTDHHSLYPPSTTKYYSSHNEKNIWNIFAKTAFSNPEW